MERTQLMINNIDDVISDLDNEFSHLCISDIQKAFKNGGLGYYGEPFRMSTTTLCIWIRKYLKDNPQKDPNFFKKGLF